jgi:hypothetical protein
MKKSITVENVCSLMNNLLTLDPECINKLIRTRIKCNDRIANHPTVQISSNPDSVGIVGILNGFFGVRKDGYGPICVELDTDNKIIKFKKTPSKK